MEKNLKILVEPKDGQVLFGSHFHVLEDESNTEFKTNELESFVRYLSETEKPDNYKLMYNENICTAVPKLINRYGDKLAFCRFTGTPALKMMENINRKTRNLDNFELFLRSMRSFLDKDGLEVLSQARNLAISKIEKVVRKKDNAGNYMFTVSRQSAGNEDFIPPPTITLTIPIIEHLPDTWSFKFDFTFSSQQADDSVSIYLKIECLDLAEEVKSAQKSIIEKNLKSLKASKFWGGMLLSTRTDDWKYKKNCSDL